MEENVQKLVTVYSFDQHGHYTGQVQAQYDPLGGDLLLPANCVAFAPEGRDGCYYTITDDKTAWEEHTWPAAAADCVGIFVEHEDHCAWAEQMRKLFEELNEGSTTHQISRDEDDLCLTVEAIPEPTKAEQASDAAEQALSDFDTELEELKDRMLVAMLQGDETAAAAVREDYSKIMEA